MNLSWWKDFLFLSLQIACDSHVWETMFMSNMLRRQWMTEPTREMNRYANMGAANYESFYGNLAHRIGIRVPPVVSCVRRTNSNHIAFHLRCLNKEIAEGLHQRRRLVSRGMHNVLNKSPWCARAYLIEGLQETCPVVYMAFHMQNLRPIFLHFTCTFRSM